MLIHRLRLYNFRQHEHTDLTLGSGLTGVIGPNGSGKTTLLEAIAWAMMMRGVEKQNSRAVTSAVRGIFRDDSKTRDEFLRLAHNRTVE